MLNDEGQYLKKKHVKKEQKKRLKSIHQTYDMRLE
jgi:hypothetical protein